ncbi:T9SS type A sorting domain-containing protein [Paracrocinitomix mangrovi]|uniref:T9SS type A sorting domain-containing protein n=1 Tax=Paracrocinitomix mangrovi TaxID=2862509 RepID=UPI001C8EF24C|nr:T9SS type A sorting domain-containing protein [Paracrocinitomix mangrovi]UKN00711.1 T9SS type A sorting domain-containing protein [Paracrocinitomix mangrovi]
MRTSTTLLPAFMLAFTCIGYSQVTIYEQNFDTLTVNQTVGNQVNEIQPISGNLGGTDDALVSDDHASSPSNSMKITNSKDMYYDCGGVTSGHYAIEFNAFMHDQGYFNIQHQKEVGWACDVFLTSSNTILYQDNPSTASATVVGSYQNDVWINFRFEIDIDNDEIKFFKDDTLLHTSVFTNATVGAGTNKLDVIDFYGLSGGFQGVNSTYMYIDDFQFINLGTSVGTNETLKNQFDVFPNPANTLIQLTNIPQDAKNVVVYNISGKQVFEQTILSTSLNINSTDFAKGFYTVTIELSDGTLETRKILITH